MDAHEQARFWSLVEYDTNGGCWLWAGVAGPGQPIPYGSFWSTTQQRQHQAHRLAWELAKGPIPNDHTSRKDQVFVLHRCDVPACVNPAHLFLGTGLDNTRDRTRKGRGIGRKNATYSLAVRGKKSKR